MKMTQEQQEELIKYLGLEEAESLDKAKEVFQTQFVKAEELSSTVGKVTGSIINVARKAFTPFGVDLTDDDFKGKKIEEVLRDASARAKESYETKTKEWEARATGNGSEELIKEWEKKHTQLEKKLKEESNARQEAITGLESFKAQVEQEKKSSTINNVFETSLRSIKTDPSVSEITMKGFRAVFGEKYIIDLEDEGSVVVKDKKNGERIKSDKKAGSFLTLEELMLKEATDANILLKNPNAGTQRPSQGQGGGFQRQEAAPNKSRGINPAFLGM
jgi:hypothetical protein